MSRNFQFLVLNDVPVMRYKESIRDIESSEPVELWNINDEGQPIFPTGKPSFLRTKDNDVYLKELKEAIIHKNVERDYWQSEFTNCYRGME